MDKEALIKVLVITYYWPPAGGPGVQRWLKFVKYLGEYGVEPIIYTPSNPNYPLTDKSLEKEIPEGIKVIKRSIFEPYKLASMLSKKDTQNMSRGLIREKEQSLVEKALLWIRGNMFVPDARKFWVKPSVKYLQKFISEEGIEVIITTGPPHSLHLIGSQLKKLPGVKWIADFRDPWTGIGYHEKLKPGKRARKLHKSLEKKVLQEADVVLATSKTTAKELSLIAGRTIETITNGFDEVDIMEHPASEKFCLSHIGSLLTGRDPEILWEVLGDMVREVEGFQEHLEIMLVGAVSEDVLVSIKKAGIDEHVRLVGYVSHDKALELQREARVLLLLEIDAKITRGIIPGKLFEYMAAQRPIIAIGPKEWEVGSILDETGAGQVFTYDDKTTLKKAVLQLYRNFLDNRKVANVHIEQYSRKALTGVLAGVIKQL